MTQKNGNDSGPALRDAESSSLATAWDLRSQGRWIEAEQTCQSILATNRGCGQAWHLLGLLAMDQRRPSDAIEHLKHAITVDPDQPVHYGNLGFILNALHRYHQAESYLYMALDKAPDYHDARCNLGLALYHQNHLEQAAACFTKILSTAANHDAALANLGMTRLAQQKYADAADAYEKAITLFADQPHWHGNLGAAYVRLGRFDEAVQCYRRASSLEPGNAEFDIYRGIALRAAGDLPESIRLLQRVVEKDPTHSAAIAHLVVGLEYTCQWDQLDLFHPMLDQSTRSALNESRRPEEDPMLNIRRCDNPAVNQAVGRAWSFHLQDRLRDSGVQLNRRSSSRHHPRITIGYLSHDFRNHPVAHQLYPMFGLHDRQRFRTVALSMGPDDGSMFRRRIEAGCDEFVDISSVGLSEACQMIFDHDVDILVDLMGHSHHNRMEILAHRPAPVQVGYLGFLSTTGASFIDYLVADAIVVPKEHEPYFDEKLLRMPHCYQFSHTNLMAGERKSLKEDSGLPADGFVFGCFNTVYKIDRDLFDTWMRILLQVPGAVLWLNGGHRTARHQMRSRAQMLGIDSSRLIFAEKIALRDHLQRLCLADVALDTLRYNGGATTANALGCGVPVLTVMGQHWVSRMSASQLMAAGLDDLVVPSIAAYEQTAIELAQHDHKLRGIRERLENQISTCPLFDEQRFVRQLETGFEMVWKRHTDGLEPEHIDIPRATLRVINE